MALESLPASALTQKSWDTELPLDIRPDMDDGWVPQLQPGGGSGWEHAETGDRWTGEVIQGLPRGAGEYTYSQSGLRVRAHVTGDDLSHLVFSRDGTLEWQDGSSYAGCLHESKFQGEGTFRWSNGDQYYGQWRQSNRHGKGVFMSRSGANLNLPAAGEGERARSLRYEGEWDSNLMHGKGVMEYFNEDVSLMVGDFPTARRRFEGTFRKGFPIEGSLRNGNEFFAHVVFDGATRAGDFAVWYWTGDMHSDTRGSSLLSIPEDSEEYRMVTSHFCKTLPDFCSRLQSLHRVFNQDRRLIFDLQRRALEKRVSDPPRSRDWDARSMEKWAFHAPGARGQANSAGHGDPAVAAPWESIVEEGFQATLAGHENGRVYGAGIYFARDASMADQYAKRSAVLLNSQKGPGALHSCGQAALPCRIFLSRILTGIYTVGNSGMNQPPLDPNGVKGEHFHSLVDCLQSPKIHVIPENTRAYPAYLVTYQQSSVAPARAPAAAPAQMLIQTSLGAVSTLQASRLHATASLPLANQSAKSNSKSNGKRPASASNRKVTQSGQPASTQKAQSKPRGSRSVILKNNPVQTQPIATQKVAESKFNKVESSGSQALSAANTQARDNHQPPTSTSRANDTDGASEKDSNHMDGLGTKNLVALPNVSHTKDLAAVQTLVPQAGLADGMTAPPYKRRAENLTSGPTSITTINAAQVPDNDLSLKRLKKCQSRRDNRDRSDRSPEDMSQIDKTPIVIDLISSDDESGEANRRPSLEASGWARSGGKRQAAEHGQSKLVIDLEASGLQAGAERQ